MGMGLGVFRSAGQHDDETFTGIGLGIFRPAGQRTHTTSTASLGLGILRPAYHQAVLELRSEKRRRKKVNAHKVRIRERQASRRDALTALRRNRWFGMFIP